MISNIYGYGFSFKGIHSSTYGIYMISDDRTINPPLRKNQVEIPGRDGTIDALQTYENRIIKVRCTVKYNTLEKLRILMRKLSPWLTGSGDLIFDDESNLRYIALSTNGISLLQGKTSAEFNIEFECQPYALDVEQTISRIGINGDAIHNDDYIYYYAPVIVKGNGIVRPIIEFTAWDGGAFYLFNPGEELLPSPEEEGNVSMYMKVSTPCIVDCERRLVYLGSENKFNYFEGEFIYFTPGSNYVAAFCPENTSVIVKYYNRYL